MLRKFTNMMKPIWPNAAQRRRLKGKAALAIAPLAVPLAAAMPARATVFTLTSGNSTASVDPSSGMTGWTVNSINQLNIQQYYYRIGSSGGQTQLDSGTQTLGTATQALPNTLNVPFANTSFSTDILYQLNAGSSPTSSSSLQETVTVTNTSASPLTLHFFKYADFNLNGMAANQTVQIAGTPPNTANQFDSLMQITSDTTGQGASGPPNEVEASIGSALLTAMQSAGTPLTLNNTLTAGPGDANWAFEWDVTLTPNGQSGDALQLSIPTTISAIPEPASLSLALGTMGLLALRRRRKNSPATLLI